MNPYSLLNTINQEKETIEKEFFDLKQKNQGLKNELELEKERNSVKLRNNYTSIWQLNLRN